MSQPVLRCWYCGLPEPCACSTQGIRVTRGVVQLAQIGLALCAFIVTGLVVATCVGCGASAAEIADVNAYQAAQMWCIEDASTRAEADACRAQVKAQWCGPGGALRAAGACWVDAGFVPHDTTTVTVTGPDAGGDR